MAVMAEDRNCHAVAAACSPRLLYLDGSFTGCVNDVLRGKRVMYKRLDTGLFAMSVILIVEDDEQVRVLAESLLRDAGYGVLAATALEGAQALLNSDQLIDLLFVDVNLGGDLEAGLRIAQNARELRPLLPVGTGATTCVR